MIFEGLSTYLRMIKFSHSIFALPFAFTSALIAAEGFPTLRQAFWITVAMVFARTAAMSLNRVIDKDIDALNPRTKDREIPSGKIRPSTAVAVSVISFFILILSAYMLNPLCLKLSPLAIVVIVVYSYTKRFTWASHLVLGLAISGAPLGAWIAIRGGVVSGAFFVALAVLFWIAGFDILYSLQDVDFDRAHNLHSIAERFGIRGAILISRIFHVGAWDFLLLTGVVFRLGFFYWLGLLIAGGLLIYEHRLVKPDDLSRLDKAFFNMNGWISITVFLATLLNYAAK